MQLTVEKALRPMLKSYKLSTSGSKAELVERILRHEAEEAEGRAPEEDVALGVLAARGAPAAPRPHPPLRLCRLIPPPPTIPRPAPPLPLPCHPPPAGGLRRLLRARSAHQDAPRFHGLQGAPRLPPTSSSPSSPCLFLRRRLPTPFPTPNPAPTPAAAPPGPRPRRGGRGLLPRGGIRLPPPFPSPELPPRLARRRAPRRLRRRPLGRGEPLVPPPRPPHGGGGGPRRRRRRGEGGAP